MSDILLTPEAADLEEVGLPGSGGETQLREQTRTAIIVTADVHERAERVTRVDGECGVVVAPKGISAQQEVRIGRV